MIDQRQLDTPWPLLSQMSMADVARLSNAAPHIIWVEEPEPKPPRWFVEMKLDRVRSLARNQPDTVNTQAKLRRARALR